MKTSFSLVDLRLYTIKGVFFLLTLALFISSCKQDIALSPEKTMLQAANVQSDPERVYAWRESHQNFGLCVLCRVDSAKNVFDTTANRQNSYSTLQVPLGVLGGGITQTIDFRNIVYINPNAAEQPFVVLGIGANPSLLGIVNGNQLNNIEIKAFFGDSEVPIRYLTRSTLRTDSTRSTLQIFPSGNITSISVTLKSGGVGILSSLKTYYAYHTKKPIEGCNSGNAKAGPTITFDNENVNAINGTYFPHLSFPNEVEYNSDNTSNQKTICGKSIIVKESSVDVNSIYLQNRIKTVFSIAGWVKPRAGSSSLFIRFESLNLALSLELVNFPPIDGNSFKIGGTLAHIGATIPINISQSYFLGRYYHLAVVSDGTNFKIYVDGKSVFSEPINIGSAALIPTFTISSVKEGIVELDDIKLNFLEQDYEDVNNGNVDARVMKLYSSYIHPED